MKRTLLVVLALSFVVASSGFSTITRVKTMGRVNQYVLDDANVFLYPSMIVRYSDRFLFDYGEDPTLEIGVNEGIRGFSGLAGGVFYGLDDYNHIGFIVNANDRTNGNGITVGVPVRGDASDYTFPVTLDDFIGIFYGYDASTVDVGLELDLSKSKNAVTNPEELRLEDKVSQFGIKGGISYDMASGDLFNVAFGFVNTSFTDEISAAASPDTTDQGPSAIAENDGYNTINLTARLFHKMNDELTLVPVFEWMIAKQGVNWDSPLAETGDQPGNPDTAAELDEVKTNTIRASLGMDISPSEKALVVAAAGIKIESGETTFQGDKLEESSSKFLPFVKAGIEAEVKPWCDFRAGVEKQLWTSSEEPVDTLLTDTEQGGADFQGFIGAGFYVADLVIDVQIDNQFLHRGPYFISGQSGNLNSRISVLFPF
jgi:hypothetical protein